MRENREIESQMTDIGESRSRIGTELSESEQTEKALEAQVESCQAALDGFREKEETAQQETEKTHLRMAGLKQRMQFLVQEEQRLHQEQTVWRKNIISWTRAWM